MSDAAAVRAVETLIRHAGDLNSAGPALAAAERAVRAAEQLDDLGLLVRALDREAAAFRMRGEDGAALARYTRVLAIAENPGIRDRPDRTAVQEAITSAYIKWVNSRVGSGCGTWSGSWTPGSGTCVR